MIVANATFETRAPFGVGDFAYSACLLSARTISSGSDSLLTGLGKQATRQRLKLGRFGVSNPAFFSAPADGLVLAPELTVVSRRAHDSALTTSIPVPALEQDVFRVTAGDFSEFASSAVTLLCREESRRFFTNAAAPVTLTCSGDARIFAGDAISLRAVAERLLSITCRCEARHCFTGACTLTVTAPWFHTPSRRAVSAYRPTCRCEAGHYLSGGLVLPKFGRALRL